MVLISYNLFMLPLWCRSSSLGASPKGLDPIGGFPKLGVPFLGVPLIRTIVFWGLYWGNLILGNYQYKIPPKPLDSHFRLLSHSFLARLVEQPQEKAPTIPLAGQGSGVF